MMKAMRKLCAAALSLALAAAGSGCSFFGGDSSNQSGSGTLGEPAITNMTLIGVSMPGAEGESEAGEALQALLKEAGYSVELAYAGGDSDTQLRQLDAMMEDECVLLIVDAVDAGAMEGYLEASVTPDVAVMAYETYLDSDSILCYLGTDYAAMGKAQAEYLVETLQLDSEDAADKAFTLEAVAGDTAVDELIYQGAMEVLSPYVESGRLVIPSGANTYSAVRTRDAAAYLERVLSAYYDDGTELDALVTTSNETANGALTAIANSYVGSIYPLVTGALCGLESAQWLNDGYLCMSTLEPELDLAAQVVQLAAQFHTGEAEDVLVEGSVVTMDNFQELLIDTGIYAISTAGTVTYGAGEDSAPTADQADGEDADMVDLEGEGDIDPDHAAGSGTDGEAGEDGQSDEDSQSGEDGQSGQDGEAGADGQ